MYKYLFLLLLMPCLSFGQTLQDLFIKDSIKTPYYSMENRTEAYFFSKMNLLKLEQETGFNAELRNMILTDMYHNKDFNFFKSTLEILVKDYGFQIAYMNGQELYYEDIIHGELADWFKKMYLKNHSIWLETNWGKQVDMRKLNELKTRDQLVNGYAAKINSISNLDKEIREKVFDYLAEYFKENADILLKITKKYKSLPTAKSFGLIQNSFGIVEVHNLQSAATYDTFVNNFTSFYKSAYLQKEIDYTVFKNIDNYSYIHYGNQIFGLLKIEEIPEYYRKTDEEIPVKDIDKLHNFKKEFKWF
nr:hypothetical protein [uncultured Flavobacterium sp.]